MLYKYVATLLGILFLSSTCFAEIPREGISISVPFVSKDPQHLRAYQLTGWYQPSSLAWEHFRVFFNVSAGHWWITNSRSSHSLNIYSASPTVRYYLQHNPHLSLFINAGIGVSYLSKTKIGQQNLGMHFSFQDQLGIGVSFGKREQISVLINALHYSNGSLCKMNAGITVPIMVSIEYGFI